MHIKKNAEVEKGPKGKDWKFFKETFPENFLASLGNFPEPFFTFSSSFDKLEACLGFCLYLFTH